MREPCSSLLFCLFSNPSVVLLPQSSASFQRGVAPCSVRRCRIGAGSLQVCLLCCHLDLPLWRFNQFVANQSRLPLLHVRFRQPLPSQPGWQHQTLHTSCRHPQALPSTFPAQSVFETSMEVADLEPILFQCSDQPVSLAHDSERQGFLASDLSTLHTLQPGDRVRRALGKLDLPDRDIQINLLLLGNFQYCI